jgi:hypothetical protein
VENKLSKLLFSCTTTMTCAIGEVALGLGWVRGKTCDEEELPPPHAAATAPTDKNTRNARASKTRNRQPPVTL